MKPIRRYLYRHPALHQIVRRGWRSAANASSELSELLFSPVLAAQVRGAEVQQREAGAGDAQPVDSSSSGSGDRVFRVRDLRLIRLPPGLVNGDGRVYVGGRLILETQVRRNRGNAYGNWRGGAIRMGFVRASHAAHSVIPMNARPARNNLWHTIFEALPQAMWLREAHEPVVLLPHTPFAFHTFIEHRLGRLNPRTRFLRVPSTQVIRADEVLIVDWGHAPMSGAHPKHVRDHVQEVLFGDAQGIGAAPSVPRRRVVFVSRAGAGRRRCINEYEVVDQIHRHTTLEVVRLESLSPEAQIAVAASTDILIGVHGAGLSFVVSPSVTGLIEIQSCNEPRPHFATAAHSYGKRYRLVQGGPANLQSDFSLDREGVQSVVDAVLEMVRE